MQDIRPAPVSHCCRASIETFADEAYPYCCAQCGRPCEEAPGYVPLSMKEDIGHVFDRLKAGEITQDTAREHSILLAETESRELSERILKRLYSYLQDAKIGTGGLTADQEELVKGTYQFCVSMFHDMIGVAVKKETSVQ